MMKKRGPIIITIRRILLRIALFSTLGIITTVGVAWGLAATVGAPPLEQLEFGIMTRPNGEVWQFTGWNRVGNARFRTFPQPDDEISRALGLPEASIPKWTWAWRTSATRGHLVDWEHATGWPAFSLMYEIFTNADGPGAVESGVAIAREPDKNLQQDGVRALPLRPIFPGFIINTLFYAAIWFGVFFGFATLRRARRKRRGRCVMCGYDLRGTPAPGGVAAGCSECGWGRGE